MASRFWSSLSSNTSPTLLPALQPQSSRSRRCKSLQRRDAQIMTSNAQRNHLSSWDADGNAASKPFTAANGNGTASLVLASTPAPRAGPRAAIGRRATTCEQQMSSHSARPRQTVGEICLYLKGSHLLSTAESLATAAKTVSLPTTQGHAEIRPCSPAN